MSVSKQAASLGASGEGSLLPRVSDRDGLGAGPADGRAGAPVAGMLLTGGASRRMGTDKASMVIDGHPSALRIGALLVRVASPVLEVGPGRSGLPAVREGAGGEGPLVALASGAMALRAVGHRGSAIVVACDLPLVTEEVLRFLVQYPGRASVVPVVDGRPQLLCARWSATDLDAAPSLVASGQRACSSLAARSRGIVLDEHEWKAVAEARVFTDVDTPEDLDRLELSWRWGQAPNAR